MDKPPAALWVMGLSVRLFGLSSAAILLPEVLMGVASVGVLYATVRRAFGAGAGLVAGLVLALTPVAVLMFRYNNPEALLVLLMTLATWATLRAVEAGSVRWFSLAGVFLGLGFLTKGLQVLLVVPFLGLAWLVLADTSLRRRALGAVVGAAALLASAGWWVAVVELVPASARPYVGGSQTNSFLELTFGYNGLGRLSGEETGSVTAGPAGAGSRWGETGLWRMFDASIGGQISWLIPSALLLLVAGLLLRGRAPRTDLRRAAYVAWGGWLLVTMLVFSFMAGIFHEYYTVALAPAVAALVGMGAAEAWAQRASWRGRVPLAAATLAAGIWSWVLLNRTDAYAPWLGVGVLLVALAAAGALVVGRALVSLAAAAALVAGLTGPAAYSVTTVLDAHTGSIVTAGPRTGSGMPGGPGGPARVARPRVARPRAASPGRPAPGGQTQNGQAATGQAPTGGPAGGPGGGLLDASEPGAEVVRALTADAGSYTWVAATAGAQNAAGLQLATELPVLAIGGFNGSDPSPTLAQFQQLVAEGRIHYFLADGGPGGGGPGGGPGGGMGGSGTAAEITSWVTESFTQVSLGGQTYYDLTQPVSG
ncbi:MAG: glycosyltransferase family 39 protein [Nocardioides sp.]